MSKLKRTAPHKSLADEFYIGSEYGTISDDILSLLDIESDFSYESLYRGNLIQGDFSTKYLLGEKREKQRSGVPFSRGLQKKKKQVNVEGIRS